ncbi:hypothetical protein HOU03_gp204 [Caulobacter phage CcrSC]|uniref:Uncharacterized protein n=1 Tax=Caulobacter phage CcrSC TaxID=2283272 RepID=A0A385EDV2_9CAUD|nr:hypothetical protein HOU03_gp204 [Caulobacter phage CcrSC]AXQ70064.1 hypothetical protein CcrSC_gp482 [Caulobacter phage CcrSC]
MPRGGVHRYVIGQRWYSSQEVQSLIVETLPKLPAGGRTAAKLDLAFGSVDLAQTTISAMLKKLAAQGRVRKVRHGHYELPSRTRASHD